MSDDTATLDTLLQEFQAKAASMGLTLPPGMLSLPTATPPSATGSTLAGTTSDSHSHLSVSAPTTPHRSGFRCKNEFERVTGDIPIEKFKYGAEDADWMSWSLRFERAVQAATNAYGRDRLEELCLIWIPLKISDGAQPIFNKCENRDKSWPLLRAELSEAFEDPRIKRRWARHMDAYKKPASITLQVYRANIIGYVHKYSPAVVNDKEAYTMELFNRFVNGLEVDWRDYIEETIPFGKETLDNAYNQALKYEAKITKKSVEFSAAAMSDAEKDTMEKMRLDIEQLKTKQQQQSKKPDKYADRKSTKQSDNWRGRSPKREDGGKDSKERRSYKNSPYRGSGDRRSSSGHSGRSSAGRSRSGSGNRQSFRAIDTADEESEAESVSYTKKQMEQAVSEGVAKAMESLSMKSKSSKSSKSSRRSPRSKKD